MFNPKFLNKEHSSISLKMSVEARAANMAEHKMLDIYGKGVVGIEIGLQSAKIKKICVKRASSRGRTVQENITKKLEEIMFCQILFITFQYFRTLERKNCCFRKY